MTNHLEAQWPDVSEAMDRLIKHDPVYALETAAYDCGHALIAYSHLEALLRQAWASGALRACGGNASLASRETHLHRNTLARMLHSDDESLDNRKS